MCLNKCDSIEIQQQYAQKRLCMGLFWLQPGATGVCIIDGIEINIDWIF